jgi:phosphonoacetaldehyde hydrolase
MPTDREPMSFPIRLVVFDMAGTIVDHGSVAPVAALVAAFRELGLELSTADARGPMGLPKRDHIAEVLRLPSVSSHWKRKFGSEPTSADGDAIYERFLPLQDAEAQARVELIPGALGCLAALRERRIAIGTTTGYPRSIGQPIADRVAAQGFVADFSLFPDDAKAGRPAPWMVFRLMELTGVYPASAVVKVGDTVPDIEEGRNAGAWTVGVTETGSEVGLTRAEWQATPAPEQKRLAATAGEKLLRAGAHAVIGSVAELPALIDELVKTERSTIGLTPDARRDSLLGEPTA